MTQQVAYYPLEGGEDLVTPPLALRPGRLLYSQNYEPGQAGGYRRIDGYERFDGRPKPSEATIIILSFDAGDNEPAVGNAVSGSVSSATGIIAGYSVTSGDWSTNDAVGVVAVHTTTGTFVNNDVLTNTTLANTLATVNGAPDSEAAPTIALDNSWTQVAIEYARSQITVVTGSGDIRGIFILEGEKYVVRDNAGATAGTIWKATSSGWSAVDLGYNLTASAATGIAPSPGSIITGGTSGATGVVVSYEADAAWSSLTTGTVYFHTLTGNFSAGGEVVSYTGGTFTTTAATQVANTLAAGGKYEYVVHNFYGQDATRMVYAANGVSKAIAFDGTGIGYIDLGGNSGVYPTHVRAHKLHLFLSYGASVINSGTGDPSDSSAAGGALEIATGDTVTGMEIIQGDVLAIFSRNSTRLLYGNNSSDFNLKDHSLTTGAREWTIQNVMNARYLDDRGFTQLNAVFNFGDFKEATFSQYIDPLVKGKLGTEETSVIVREKNQYRCFYDDGSALICRVTDTNQFPQFTRVLYDHVVKIATSGENSLGQEEVFFGSTDGYVYQMDKGTSFDGATMDYILRLPFNNLKSPRNKKRFFKAILEIDAPTEVTLYFTPDFSYGSADFPKALQQTFSAQGSAAYWDEEINWNSFIWGSESPGSVEAYIDGSGTNMAFLISGSSIYEESHTITSVMLHYKVRGLKR